MNLVGTLIDGTLMEGTFICLKLNDGNFILGSFLWDLDLVSVSSVSLLSSLALSFSKLSCFFGNFFLKLYYKN